MAEHLLSMVTCPMWLQHEGITQGRKKCVLSSHHVLCTPPGAAVRDGELLSTNLLLWQIPFICPSCFSALNNLCLRPPETLLQWPKLPAKTPYKQADQTRRPNKNHIHLNYVPKQHNWIYTKYCPFTVLNNSVSI